MIGEEMVRIPRTYRERQRTKLSEYEINLIREMNEAKIWEGYPVTPKHLAEWFFCTDGYIREILRGKVRKVKEENNETNL